MSANWAHGSTRANRFARIVARPGDPASEYVLHAPQAGRLVTRSRERFIVHGEVAAKLTGSTPSAGWRGGPLDPLNREASALEQGGGWARVVQAASSPLEVRS